jgi:nucleoside 2-deoxyribosyltransferase
MNQKLPKNFGNFPILSKLPKVLAEIFSKPINPEETLPKNIIIQHKNGYSFKEALKRVEKYENRMQYLKDKTVYLCGSIFSKKDSGIKWRNQIIPKLESLNIQVLNPCDKTSVQEIDEIGTDKQKFRNIIRKENWKDLKEAFWPIVRYDLRCIDKCDFIIFNYDPNIPMVGSVHELVVANMEKKVILLKYNKKDLNKFNPWIATFIKKEHFFSNWDHMFQYLQKVDNGEFDTSYWI